MLSLLRAAPLFGPLLALVALGCGDDSGTGGTAGSPSDAGSPPVGGGGNGAGPMGGGGSGGSPEGGGGAGGGGGGAGGNGGGGGCPTSLPVIEDLPMYLSETGLYEDIETDTVASWARPFEPQYPLWSDDAEKRRWIYIPECGAQIDTADMDTWQVPVGTRLWKEFTRDGVRVETRIIMRYGPDDIDFEFGAYVWDGSGDAVLTDSGLMNANGTGHDVPAKPLCSGCHKRDWRVLGFSAIQLSHGLPGETIASLSDEGLLTVPAPAGFPVPGDAVSEPALGYLHSNCGNCHYEEGLSNIPMRLRLYTDQTTVETTSTFLTAIDQVAVMYSCGGCDVLEPGVKEASAIWMRMNESSMPPVASEVVDVMGRDTVGAWIDSLPPTP